jgi:hypothetical protein
VPTEALVCQHQQQDDNSFSQHPIFFMLGETIDGEDVL